MLMLLLLIATAGGLLVNSQPFPDWLVTDISMSTQLVHLGTHRYRLTNGLISRDFLIYPDFATVEFYSHEKKQSVLRAIRLVLSIACDCHHCH